MSGFNKVNHQKDDSLKFSYSNISEYGYEIVIPAVTESFNDDLFGLIYDLKNFFSERQIKFNYYVNYISLLEEGALQVPLVFSAGKMNFSVFFIYNNQDARKYNDAKTKIPQTFYSNPLFFSVIDLKMLQESISATRTLKLADLSFDSKAIAIGEYAMWWADDAESVFGNSETCNILLSTYQIFRQYESVYTGYLMHQLGLIKELSRADLPENEKALTVIGPEQKVLLIVLSKEKGIRFLFPVKSTTKFYREQFLYAINVDFLALKLSIREQGIEKDNTNGSDSFHWFSEQFDRTCEMEKEGKQIKRFGNNHVMIM